MAEASSHRAPRRGPSVRWGARKAGAGSSGARRRHEVTIAGSSCRLSSVAGSTCCRLDCRRLDLSAARLSSARDGEDAKARRGGSRMTAISGGSRCRPTAAGRWGRISLLVHSARPEGVRPRSPRRAPAAAGTWSATRTGVPPLRVRIADDDGFGEGEFAADHAEGEVTLSASSRSRRAAMRVQRARSMEKAMKMILRLPAERDGEEDLRRERGRDAEPDSETQAAASSAMNGDGADDEPGVGAGRWRMAMTGTIGSALPSPRPRPRPPPGSGAGEAPLARGLGSALAGMRRRLGGCARAVAMERRTALELPREAWCTWPRGAAGAPGRRYVSRAISAMPARTERRDPSTGGLEWLVRCRSDVAQRRDVLVGDEVVDRLDGALRMARHARRASPRLGCARAPRRRARRLRGGPRR